MITVVVGKEIEKIKGEFESVINGMNMVGKIPYNVYSELFDVGAECIQKAYELGKSELEAGRSKWHDLCKNPDDLPEIRHPVYAKLDSGTYVFAYCVNKIWHGNDDGVILHHGNGKSEVIAWCEIPRLEETNK